MVFTVGLHSWCSKLSLSFASFRLPQVLSVSNVETIVVFRSCTPLAISIFDYLFYQRELPSSRSCASLFLIVTGAAGYMLTDREFQLHGVKAYFWAGIWWVVTVIQLTLGKFLVGSLDNKTLWTPGGDKRLAPEVSSSTAHSCLR